MVIAMLAAAPVLILAAALPAGSQPPISLPEGARFQADVPYCKTVHAALKMDVYLPAPEGSGLRPAAVYIHGGGWQGGDKASGDDLADFPELLRRGYIVASVNYRHAPEYKFPAQIQDVRCAVRFLRAHAAEYRLDPGRVAAWGASAGGHLAALLGLADAAGDLDDPGELHAGSCSVQAVVDLYGPVDLRSEDLPPRTREIIGLVFGSGGDALRRGSPVAYVRPSAPPFLILHGERDESVPLSQSQKLWRRLNAAGVRANLVRVQNAGHVFKPVGGSIRPSRKEITTMIADFLDRNLKSSK